MEVFTIKEWEENFDVLFKRVEEGETIGVVREDGKAAVFMPSDEAEFLCSGITFYQLLITCIWEYSLTVRAGSL